MRLGATNLFVFSVQTVVKKTAKKDADTSGFVVVNASLARALCATDSLSKHIAVYSADFYNI